jgi:hypothetical protein
VGAASGALTGEFELSCDSPAAASPVLAPAEMPDSACVRLSLSSTCDGFERLCAASAPADAWDKERAVADAPAGADVPAVPGAPTAASESLATTTAEFVDCGAAGAAAVAAAAAAAVTAALAAAAVGAAEVGAAAPSADKVALGAPACATPPEVAAVPETAESASLPPVNADLATPSVPGTRAAVFAPGRSAATLGAFALVFPAAAAGVDEATAAVDAGVVGADAVVAAAAEATDGAVVAVVNGALGRVSMTGGCAGVEAAAEAALTPSEPDETIAAVPSLVLAGAAPATGAAFAGCAT